MVGCLNAVGNLLRCRNTQAGYVEDSRLQRYIRARQAGLAKIP